MSTYENSIHPTAVIIGDVVFGSGNTVGPFCVIEGPVTIGDANWIGSGVHIGPMPEIRNMRLNDRSEAAGIRIGNRNTIREGSQIHQGWQQSTVIADDTYIMNQCYVAHDCRIANRVTLASSVLLAGHVEVGTGANLGMGVVVHQRRRIGPGSVVGMAGVVSRDIPALAKAYGNPARIMGANVIGMERAGIDKRFIDEVCEAYGPEGKPTPGEIELFESQWEIACGQI